MVSEEEFDLLFYKLKDLILEQSEGEWDDATIVRDAHHFANHLRPLLTAAPVREEGGVVETALKIATDLHHAYEQLIYGLPKYLEAENLTDEENMIREAWITLDVTAHRLAALAERLGPEWTPEVWENCGWNYAANNGAANVHPSRAGSAIKGEWAVNGYTCYLNLEQQFIARADDPVNAFHFAVQDARSFISRMEGGVVLAKRVSPGEAINRAVGDEVLTAKALESITTAGWVFAHKDDIATREEAPAEAGERDVIARLVDPQTFDLIASYTGIDRGDGLTPAERESAVFWAYPKLKEDRDTAFAKADTIIALRAQPQAISGEG